MKTSNENNENRLIGNTVGDLQIWHVPDVPGQALFWPVTSPTEAMQRLDMLTEYDNYLWSTGLREDFSNAAGLVVWDGQEWVDWESPDGETFDEWVEGMRS